MADRKAELERKKEKLRLIREEKERRKREREEAEAKGAALKIASGQIGSGAAASPSQGFDINKQLADLGVQPVDKVLESLSTIASNPSIRSEGASEKEGEDKDGSPASFAIGDNVQKPRKPVNLAVSTVHQTNIPGKTTVTYDKTVQTTESGNDARGGGRSGGLGRDYYTFAFDDDPEEMYAEDSIPGMESGSTGSGSPSNLFHHLKQIPGFAGLAAESKESKENEEEKKKKEEEEKRKKDLSEEEKAQILMSENFHQFFSRASRLVERAVNEDVDIFKDYTGMYDNNEGLEDKAGYSLTFNRYFFDEKWSRNRVVTSLDWSTAFPELLVASYDKNPDSAADVDGVCLVWNTRFKKDTPDDVFHCQSQVMSATFARFHPNLILGGTYSGQIVLWDNRVPKKTPVQRSPLSSAAHTHPVYCMKVVGNQNAHNLISISTDGKMCSWSLDMLSQPQETLELQQKQTKAVAVTSLSFPTGDVNNFIVGSEEGSVYTACRHGSRAGVLDVFEGHQAPVTGVDTHPGGGTVDFSHLFLTSSMDWTVKLWSLKEARPLYSFEDNGDYVYDTAWSPVHPGLFAAVDGSGRLDLWNLNSDTEVATASVVVEGAPALNRVSWTQSGLHVTVGDDSGKIWVYDVGEQLALPIADEWSKFVYTLQDIKHNQAEDDIEARMSMGYHSGGSSMSSMIPANVGGGGGSGPGSLSSLPSLTASPMR